jgi:uncharacterized membrane protein YjjP (DUF1212 family)
MVKVAVALGMVETDIVVFPTALIIQSGSGPLERTRINSFRRFPLRLDQISEIDDLTRCAERGEIRAEAGLQAIGAIERSRPSMGPMTRIVGHAVLSTGFALLLQPTPAGVLLAFGLGIVVGALRVIDLPRIKVILPVLATFAVSIAVFEVARRWSIENPIRMLIPPLVLFLPGAALTTGTMELAAGDAVSGSSRLVEGAVNLLLLTFGILAAAAVVHVPSYDLIDNPTPRLGWITPLLGLIVIVLGHYWHSCAPRRALVWILLVQCVAFAGQAAGARLFAPDLSGFFGAIVMTPLILWLSSRDNGPPEMTLFLPAFWILVPGATGLIGVTQAVGVVGVKTGSFGETPITLASITLGILLGAATWSATTDVASFARDLFTDRA